MRDIIYLKINDLHVFTGINNVKYSVSSPSVIRGGHIVSEYFDFIKQPATCENIIGTFLKRSDERKSRRQQGKVVADKSINPLATLPAAPGSGKSAFLVHFPEDESFKRYVAAKADLSVVSTLTFNGEMADGPLLLPLRILYGTGKSMGLFDDTTWETFINYDVKMCWDGDNVFLDTHDVIDILTTVFGEKKKIHILILVDEK